MDNKNINAITLGERRQLIDFTFPEGGVNTIIPFTLWKRQTNHVYRGSFTYDIQFNTSSSVDIDVFAIVDEDAKELPFLPVVIKDEYPVSSSIFSKIYKGVVERVIQLVSNGAGTPSGVFEIRTESGKEIYKNLEPEETVKLVSSDVIYNLDEKTIITITNMSDVQSVKVLHLIPLDISSSIPKKYHECPMDIQPIPGVIKGPDENQYTL